MTKSVSIAWMKAHLSDVVGEVQHKKSHIVIEKHGKPVAMLVPVSAERPRGLQGWFGALDDFPELADVLDQVVAARGKERRRRVAPLAR